MIDPRDGSGSDPENQKNSTAFSKSLEGLHPQLIMRQNTKDVLYCAYYLIVTRSLDQVMGIFLDGGQMGRSGFDIEVAFEDEKAGLLDEVL